MNRKTVNVNLQSGTEIDDAFLQELAQEVAATIKRKLDESGVENVRASIMIISHYDNDGDGDGDGEDQQMGQGVGRHIDPRIKDEYDTTKHCQCPTCRARRFSRQAEIAKWN